MAITWCKTWYYKKNDDRYYAHAQVSKAYAGIQDNSFLITLLNQKRIMVCRLSVSIANIFPIV